MIAAPWADRRLPVKFWLSASPEPNSGCWLRAGHSGRIAKARRRAYERLIGRVPDGQYIEPTCGGSCVNPFHAICKTPLPLALRKKHKRDRVTPYQRFGFYISSKYGITLKEFERMLAAQSGRCVICDSEFVHFGGAPHLRPHIDHDHATGRVRGLLCMHCNSGIGHFKDRPERMVAAVAYLAKHGEAP